MSGLFGIWQRIFRLGLITCEICYTASASAMLALSPSVLLDRAESDRSATPMLSMGAADPLFLDRREDPSISDFWTVDAVAHGVTAPRSQDAPEVSAVSGGDASQWVDAPFAVPLVLGNRIWNEQDPNGLLDAGESGAQGITVTLYRDTNRDGAYTIGTDTLLSTTKTAAGGYYTFAGLQAGGYLVVLPATDFVAGAPLWLRQNTTTTVSGNSDLDGQDHGYVLGGVLGNGGLVASTIVTLALGQEPVSDGDDSNGNLTLDFGFYLPQSETGEACYVSSESPIDVRAGAYQTWTIDYAAGTVTVRTTLAKTFVDNTYGTNAVGWPSGHTFANLTGSDQLQLALYDASGTRRIEFQTDYISADASRPSGYGTLKLGGDGDMVFGNASYYLSATTSLDVNFNRYGYVLTSNSPRTDISYTTNITYPNWIYEVWYESVVSLAAFPGGFGSPNITGIHASPSKTGSNTEAVTKTTCAAMTLGNQIWFDTNNDGILGASESGVSGVSVELYRDTNGDGVFTPGVDAYISRTTTIAGGYYSFTGLLPRDYLVVVTSTNFEAGGALAGYQNSALTLDGNSDQNSRDHGAVVGTPGNGGYVASSAVSLLFFNEPTSDGDNNANTNLTIDFGFYRLTLGDTVWDDLNNDGLLNNGETGVGGVTVVLYSGATPIATTTTDATGLYTFTGLVSGTYSVGIVLPEGYASSTDIGSSSNPDNNVNSDDNGVLPAGNEVRSNPVILIPGFAGVLNNNTVTAATGTTRNPTLDFGIARKPTPTPTNTPTATATPTCRDGCATQAVWRPRAQHA